MTRKNIRPVLAIRKYRYLMDNKARATKGVNRYFQSGVVKTSFDQFAEKATASFWRPKKREGFFFFVNDTPHKEDREYLYVKHRPDLPAEQDGKVGKYDVIVLREVRQL